MDFQRFFSPSPQTTTASAHRPSGSVNGLVQHEPHSGSDAATPVAVEDGHVVELRRAQLRDLPALTELLTRSFHGQPNQPFWLQAILRFSIQEDLRQRLQHGHNHQACWVAVRRPTASSSKDASQLVGTVEMGLRSPLTLGWPLSVEAWIAPNRSFLYISNLAVASHYRRQGIAQLLLQRCEQTALTWQQSQLYLHVLEHNRAARNLYHLAGFGFERLDPSLESLLFNRDRRQLWRKQLTPPPRRSE
jgi:ribosomal protein S18 acetylase RimI-like enzyme